MMNDADGAVMTFDPSVLSPFRLECNDSGVSMFSHLIMSSTNVLFGGKENS